jgi:hypothetical protein
LAPFAVREALLFREGLAGLGRDLALAPFTDGKAVDRQRLLSGGALQQPSAFRHEVRGLPAA